jgi:BON domain
MNARSMLVGAATGSALMFILDPDRGRRRRALVRDKMTRASRKTRDGLDAAARDIANRASGIAAEARGRWSGAPADDATIVERVRATLGRYCSHPRAIDVFVRDGCVTLRGPVLAAEVPDILAAVALVRDVTDVANELEPHETADVPSLQGAGRIPGSSIDILQNNWAPATRALVGTGLLAAGVWMAMRAAR